MARHGPYQPDFGNVNISGYNITARQEEAQAANPLQFNQRGFGGLLGRWLTNFRRDRPRLFNRGVNEQGQTLGVFGRPIGSPRVGNQGTNPYSSSYIATLPRTQAPRGMAASTNPQFGSPQQGVTGDSYFDDRLQMRQQRLGTYNNPAQGGLPAQYGDQQAVTTPSNASGNPSVPRERWILDMIDYMNQFNAAPPGVGQPRLPQTRTKGDRRPRRPAHWGQ